MINCPNCGQPVREGQRFCGVCGADVQAALAASTPPASEQEPASPYAYSANEGYSYEPEKPPAPVTGRMLVAGAVLVLALCCVFACGILFGFEIIPDLLGYTAAPPARVPPATVTPAALNLVPVFFNWVLRVRA